MAATSLAAHLFLILFIDTQIIRTTELKSDKISSENIMSIHLLTPETRPPKIDLEAAAIEIQSQARATTHSDAPGEKLPPPNIDILIPQDPHYFSARELTEKPQVLHDIPPDLAATLNSGAPHSAIFRLRINENGAIDQVIVDASEFPEPEQKLLIDAFSEMTFTPGKVADIPVKSEIKIEILTERIPPVAPQTGSRTSPR